MKLKLIIALLVGFAVLLSGCTQQNNASGNGNSNGTVQDSASITIENYSFSPADVTVRKGGTVTWTNKDSAQHTATGDNSEFDTGLLSQGQSKAETFNTVGVFTYHCTPHPYMKAKITVVE